MSKCDCGKFQERFEKLWALMARIDARKAQEISGKLVSGVIGCSERYGNYLFMEKLRRRFKNY